MNEIGAREEQLLRVIGEDRAAHPPKLVAAAERELARRAGGTRRQARRRIRIAGALVALVGVLIGGVGFGVYEAVVLVFGPSPGLGGASVTADVIALVGLAVVALGVAVALRVRWLLRLSAVIPFLRREDVEAAAYSPDTAELLRIIGSDRPTSLPEAVGAAERQLGPRLESGRVHREARVRSWGGLATVLGVLMVLNSALAGLLMLLVEAAEELEPQLVGAVQISGAEVVSTWAGVVVHAAVGAVLLVGGLGLRARKDWGRRTVLWGLWASFGAALLFSVAAAPFTVARSGLTGWMALSLLGTVALDAAWLAVCWWAARALCRPEIREACGVEVPLR